MSYVVKGSALIVAEAKAGGRSAATSTHTRWRKSRRLLYKAGAKSVNVAAAIGKAQTERIACTNRAKMIPHSLLGLDIQIYSLDVFTYTGTKRLE